MYSDFAELCIVLVLVSYQYGTSVQRTSDQFPKKNTLAC